MSAKGKKVAKELAELIGQGQNSLRYLPGATLDENRAALQEARRLYFQGHSFQVVQEVTGLPQSRFLKLRPQWEKLKERELQRIVGKNIREGKGREIQEIVALSLRGLKEHVRRIVARAEDMSGKDAKLLSDIIANVDRIGRLESGTPTEIKRYESMTPAELKEEAKQIITDLELEDPVVDYKEVCH